MSTKGHVFISYRHKRGDQDLAERLRKDLENAGLQIWIDQGISGGADWRESIQRAIESCSVMIAVLSPQYVVSKHCLDELAVANDLNRPVIPVDVKEVPHVPIAIVRNQRIDFQKWRDEKVYREKFEALVKALQAEGLTVATTQPPARVPQTASPRKLWAKITGAAVLIAAVVAFLANLTTIIEGLGLEDFFKEAESIRTPQVDETLSTSSIPSPI